jgi:2-keto-4-pentenoate hydratase/2-oxohepta-3-ene-1,7-dioic acid hydratase in catechol pathway
MKIASYDERAALIVDDTVVDVAAASAGRFGPDVMDVYEQWDDFCAWASGVGAGPDPVDESRLGCPVPRPRQVFGIGLNYRTHAEESGMQIPEVPATFTKFVGCLAGPFDEVGTVGETTDWEVELVAVIGRLADRVDQSAGWDHVAGLTVGQDISDRTLQFAAGMQFSLGKSRRGYGPMGPWVVTPDELADRDDIALGCAVDGETVQDARTSDLIFDVPRLVAELSAVLPLYPGDIIFTGTPSGVGMARQPPRALAPGQVLESWIEGIGTIRNPCV